MKNRNQALVLMPCYVLLLLLAVWMVWPAPPAGFYWDDSFYLWSAEWLSQRAELRDVAGAMLGARQYPAFFPWLAMLAGAGQGNEAPALLLNALFMASACFITVLWMIRHDSWRTAAVVGALLLLLNPVSLMFFPAVLSEPLFILLSVSALMLATAPEQTRARWMLIGILTGLAIATRSAGWALLFALVLNLLVHRRFDSLQRFVPLAIAGIAIDYLLRSGMPEAPQYVSEFGRVISQINISFLIEQASALGQGWLFLWGSAPGALLAALLVLPGWIDRLRTAEPDALYLLLSLGMLMLWPYPDHMARLIWVLMPAVLISMRFSMRWLGQIPSHPLVFTALLGLVLALALPQGAGRSLMRMATPPEAPLSSLSRMHEWTRAEDRESGLVALQVRAQFLEDAALIREHVPAEYCIYSELPAVISIQAGRAAYASPWQSLEDITTQGCAWYYLVPDALGANAAQLEQFSRAHTLVFSSEAPYEQAELLPLGMLFRLATDH